MYSTLWARQRFQGNSPRLRSSTGIGPAARNRGPKRRVEIIMKPTAELDPRLPSSRSIPTLEFAENIPTLESVSTAAPAAVLPITELSVADLVPAPARVRRSFHDIVWALLSVPEWLFGMVCLFIGLAALAALPIFQFLSLGYLLEAGGRVARTGRFRDGFIGVRLAARLGGIVAGSWLLLLPVRYVSDVARSAEIIDPGGRAAAGWRLGLLVLIVVTFVQIASACALGGKLRYFVSPFNLIVLAIRVFKGRYYTSARNGVWETVMALRLPYYFWLGLRGFIGAFAWLVVPVSLLALSRGTSPVATLAGWVGALLLTIVLLYLPFLQMRLAATNRLTAVFDLRATRAQFARAPWAFAFSFFITLLFALPLYLLKIEIVPREAAWLPSLVFIIFIFPALMPRSKGGRARP